MRWLIVLALLGSLLSCARPPAVIAPQAHLTHPARHLDESSTRTTLTEREKGAAALRDASQDGKDDALSYVLGPSSKAVRINRLAILTERVDRANEQMERYHAKFGHYRLADLLVTRDAVAALRGFLTNDAE